MQQPVVGRSWAEFGIRHDKLPVHARTNEGVGIYYAGSAADGDGSFVTKKGDTCPMTAQERRR